MKKIKVFMISHILSIGILLPGAALAETSVDELKKEIAALRRDMVQMQNSYETKIVKLEERLNNISSSGQKEDKAVSLSAYDKKTKEAELPLTSVILNTELNLSDNPANDNKDKFRLKEAEIALSGYLHPDVKGDFVAAFEQVYEGDDVSTETDIEEAYVKFLNLPFGVQATVGRKFLDFGRLNPVHSHHWNFTETPLVMQNFIGNHSWGDDGLYLSYLIPNPMDWYWNFSLGVYNGKNMGHSHSHSHDEAEEHDEHEHVSFGEELISWDGHVYLGRMLVDFPFSDNLNTSLGYTLAADDNSRNRLHGVDFVMKYQWPSTYRKVKWHSEFFKLEDDEKQINPYGLFSYLTLGLNKNWETGIKYDYSEFADNDKESADAFSLFLTYYFNHTMYVRLEGQRKNHASGLDEDQVFLQFVWGIGPHAHGMQE